MLWLILFIFGLAIGSFLNVVALRYDGERFVLSPRTIGGRSHCPHCKKTLQWYELIPLVSWIVQRGRCRNCKAKLGWHYPLVELLSAAIFVAIPLRFSLVPYFAGVFGSGAPIAGNAAGAAVPHLAAFAALSAIWIIAFEIFLLVAYIDIRLTIIPDELNIALAVVALAEIVLFAHAFGGTGNPSFFGAYAAVFGLQANVWINHLIAAVAGVAFFGAIVAVTRGRGMGMGDVKFALPLGLLFGWPDILIIAMMAFVIGGVYGLIAITAGKKTMKSAVPFGPFLVAASTVAFFAGSALFNWYFHMLGL
jgi:leader peptidase (prepilin peptidase)/N-methyltransferase